MARSLASKPQTVAPDATYEYGNIRDTSGSTLGTPVNTLVYGDFHQFFEKLMDEAGVSANGLPDNTTNGYQLYDAYKAGFQGASKMIFTALFGNLQANKLYVAGIGVLARTGGGGDYGIDTPNSGIAYYNGVSAIINPSATVLGFGISGQQPKIIYKAVPELTTQSLSPSEGVLIPYVDFEGEYDKCLNTAINPSFINVTPPTGSSGILRYRVYGNRVSVECALTGLNASVDVVIGFPSGLRPTYSFFFSGHDGTNPINLEFQHTGGFIVKTGGTAVYFILEYFLD